jgi:hypothetical protein
VIVPERPAFADSAAPPPVWGWYRAFCVAWALFYALLIGFSAWLLATGDPPPATTIAPALAMGLWFGLCAVLLVAYAIAPLLPRKPWTWIYGIVIIAFSALGGCFFVAIPLLVFWIRPDMQAYLGRASRPSQPAQETTAGGLASDVADARVRRLRRWYIALMLVTALTYLAIGAVGLLSLVDPELAGDRFEDMTLAVVGCALFPIFLAAAFLPRRPWAWRVGAAFIVAAMLTCCTLPFAVPLLIAWLDPRTRAGYGVSTGATLT